MTIHVDEFDDLHEVDIDAIVEEKRLVECLAKDAADAYFKATKRYSTVSLAVVRCLILEAVKKEHKEAHNLKGGILL